MKRYFLGALFVAISLFCRAQVTPIPDANFEQDLVDQGIDTNGLTGDILNSDAEATTIYVAGRDDITDFTGIGAFVNLVTLNTSDNQFEEISLDNLTALEDLFIGRNGLLTNLDLSNNLVLKTLEIRPVEVDQAPIISPDLSPNEQLEVVRLSGLINLSNAIFAVNNNINFLSISGTAIGNFDLADFGKLEFLDISYNSFTVDMNLTLPDEKTVLQTIQLWGAIQSLDLSQYVALDRVALNNTHIDQFIPSSSLRDIRINNHDLSVLDLSTAPNLDRLYVDGGENSISLDVDITACANLTFALIHGSEMTSIDVSGNPILRSLSLRDNNLSTIDLSQNTELTGLNLEFNQFSALDQRL